MDKVFGFIKQWKSWILRGLVGAAIAILLGYVAGIHVWLVGAIIAIVAELATARLTKPFNDLLKLAESKLNKAKDVAEDAAEKATDVAEEVAEKTTTAAKSTAKKATTAAKRTVKK